MRRAKDVGTMRKIAEIRAIQRQSAEMEVARAAQALRRLDRVRADDFERIDGGESGWQAMIAAPTLSLDIAGAWSADIVAGQAALALTDANIGEAQREKAVRSGAWNKAVARSEAADDMARAADRAVRRRREEAALEQLADRVARRGRTA